MLWGNGTITAKKVFTRAVTYQTALFRANKFVNLNCFSYILLSPRLLNDYSLVHQMCRTWLYSDRFLFCFFLLLQPFQLSM